MSALVQDDESLKNPVWASLTTFHAGVALKRGHAARYPSTVAAFIGLPDAATDEDWREAAALPSDGSPVFHVADTPATPPDSVWTVLARREALQMIAPDDFGRLDDEAILLESGDVTDMMALAADAGPAISFRPGAIELGDFYGIRVGEHLVGMGGSRFHGPGWVELSGGCVHSDHRGRGFGRRLLQHRAAIAASRNEVAMLLVFTDNPARHLFSHLGWRTLRTMHGTLMRTVEPTDQPADGV